MSGESADSQKVDMQLQELRDFVKRSGWKVHSWKAFLLKANMRPIKPLIISGHKLTGNWVSGSSREVNNQDGLTMEKTLLLICKFSSMPVNPQITSIPNKAYGYLT